MAGGSAKSLLGQISSHRFIRVARDEPDEDDYDDMAALAALLRIEPPPFNCWRARASGASAAIIEG